MIIDNIKKEIYLFGDAIVTYTNMSLSADFIVLNWEESIATAEGLPDSTGRLAGLPTFKDGDQEFQMGKMRYNFETERGIIYDVVSQQQDVIVRGNKTKYVGGDTKSRAEDVIYSQDAIFTTCTADHPHFGIRSNKQKVVPNKVVVVGPSQMEIMDVPTPIWLPFGFFPISSGRSTGLLFPRDFEYSNQLGFGLRDVGWFFPIGETFNLALTSDIYLKGSWGIRASARYRQRYRYNGNFRIGFNSQRRELPDATFTNVESFSLNWSHRQDATAHPTNTFGGSINLQTNNYQSIVNNDANNVFENQLNSNMTFTKNWLNRPFNFTAAFNHSQNTRTRNVTINFPNLRFVTSSINPFEREVSSGGRRWYEEIVMQYSAEARNRIQVPDTALFTNQALESAEFGVNQRMSLNTSFKLLRYLNVVPSVNYEETWNWRSLDYAFDDTPTIETDTIFNPEDSTDFQIVMDTTDFGQVLTDTLWGFRAFRQYSASVGVNTQIFGTLRFRGNGLIRGLRHIIKPSLSFVFAPNYLNSGLDYFDQLPTDSRFPEQTQTFPTFGLGIFGGPPQSGRQMAISYGFNNIFEAKVRSRRERDKEGERKIKLFDNLRVNGNYNFAADSLRWSPVTVIGTARFFEGITILNLNAAFDPYIENAQGRRINTTVLEDRGRLVRLDRAQARFTTNITISKLRKLFTGEQQRVVTDLEEEAKTRERERRERRQQEDNLQSFYDLFQNFRIAHNIVFNWQALSGGPIEYELQTHTVDFRGSIQLTKNWGINVGNFGYDFRNKRISYPSVGFYRDLHCWELTFDWFPQRNTYNFNIRVKPGSFDFIKIPYQRNNVDGTATF